MKKLIPAICMLLVATMLLAGSTFAWFSMNTVVTATGMQVTAKAEEGIVITNSEKSTWSDASSTTTSKDLVLLPTSTVDGSVWYHNTSKDADVATGAGYVGTYETVTKSEDAKYYSDNVFYIASSVPSFTGIGFKPVSTSAVVTATAVVAVELLLTL